MINVGSNKVHPLEVEQVIRQVPGISDVRVYAKSSSIAGQLVACDLVIAPGTDQAPVRETVAAHCVARLSEAQRPRLFRVVDQVELRFARSTTGRSGSPVRHAGVEDGLADDRIARAKGRPTRDAAVFQRQHALPGGNFSHERKPLRPAAVGRNANMPTEKDLPARILQDRVETLVAKIRPPATAGGFSRAPAHRAVPAQRKPTHV